MQLVGLAALEAEVEEQADTAAAEAAGIAAAAAVPLACSRPHY